MEITDKELAFKIKTVVIELNSLISQSVKRNIRVYIKQDLMDDSRKVNLSIDKVEKLI